MIFFPIDFFFVCFLFILAIVSVTNQVFKIFIIPSSLSLSCRKFRKNHIAGLLRFDGDCVKRIVL